MAMCCAFDAQRRPSTLRAAETGCVGPFLDTSKNRSRRWCTTDGCGVGAKVQRQAVRRRAARSI
jgi:predicted RNA-binding Zn ribbon-like protein